MRNPEDVITEIQYHIRNYGISHIEFNDLLCNGNLVGLEKLCDLMIKAKIQVKWISYAAIRKNMTKELLDKMKQAGCNSLCYGIESGSNRILKRMNKHYTKQEAQRLLRDTHNAGINTSLNIIAGFPGETEDDFEQTLDFLRENKQFIHQVTNVSAFVLMPGADLSIYPHRFGIRFIDSNDPGKYEIRIKRA